MKIFDKIYYFYFDTINYLKTIIVLKVIWSDINKFKKYYDLDKPYKEYIIITYYLSEYNMFLEFFKPINDYNETYFQIWYESDVHSIYDSRYRNFKINQKFIKYFSNFNIEVRKRKLKNIK